VDSRLKEIHVKPNSERIEVVSYTDATRAIYRGREQRVESLEAGDVVAMQVKENPPGRYHSEFVSVREKRQDRNEAK
jgi:hypothetical protein